MRPKLRALWALHVTGGLDEKTRLALLDHSSPQVRAWAVRLAVDDGSPSADALNRFQEMANHDRLDALPSFHRQPGAKGWADASPLVRVKAAEVLWALEKPPAPQSVTAL